ncbi:hypothetical protein PFLUV_G00164070 [Perca fluviatilis]|uniref:Uncharacterized protein n=1 Tax=Perca fluviatilis TaxID=8168 RepID=A0A6A5EHZ1_PERFL|nr:hypothetical protein PFLUV_G00164070 [Perca fluviatilis]
MALQDTLVPGLAYFSVLWPGLGVFLTTLLSRNRTELLAKTVFTLHSPAVLQLSKRDRFDLACVPSPPRSITLERNCALFLSASNKEILLMAMKDMDIAKLTSTDLPLQVVQCSLMKHQLWTIARSSVVQWKYPLNSVTMSLGQLYGENDLSTSE